MKHFLAQAVALVSTSLAVLALASPGLSQGPGTVEGAAVQSLVADDPVYHPSGSPWLRVPEDLRDYPPLEPPVPLAAPLAQSLAESAADPLAVEEYNVATGETTRILSTPAAETTVAETRSTPPFAGLAPSPANLESVFVPDGRTRVQNTESVPWRSVVKLLVTFPGGSGWCSGAIVGCGTNGFHVLTAGHCVYNHSSGGWADSIRVYPGLDDDYAPYNHAEVSFMRTYSGWINTQDNRHDWALVTLDRRVGNYTGWMGRQTGDPASGFYTGNLTTAGYPCNVKSDSCPDPVSPADTMWTDSDVGRTADTFRHWYYMDTQAGQSGSPVWRTKGSDGSRYILSVHTTGNDGSGSNHGTRLEQDKFDDIADWCAVDPLPTDKADLIDDGQDYSGFSPSVVDPGGTSFSVWNDVRNIGTLLSTPFNVTYYASTDTTITGSDYEIGTFRMNPSITPFTYRDAAWSGIFPDDIGIPDGSYWVGWIIDSEGEVPEFEELNNTAHKTSYKLTVCDRPPAPVLSLPSNGHSACEDQPLFDWSDVSGASSYRIQIGDDPAFGSPEYNAVVLTSLYSPAAPLVGGTHHWRVAASNGCGQGPWSGARSFTVRQISEAPSLIAPGDGRFTCQSRAILYWTPMDLATEYWLEVDPDLSAGPPAISENVTEPYYPAGGMLGLDTYDWRVTARNECGDGPTAPVWTFDVLDCVPVHFPVIYRKAP